VQTRASELDGVQPVMIPTHTRRRASQP
jgi:hypothetical protein